MKRALLAAALLAACLAGRLNAQPDVSTAASVTASTQAASAEVVTASVTIRGVHMTGWAAGLSRTRHNLIVSAKAAGLNAVVVALKEYDGRMFVKGVPLAREIGAYVNAIPDLAAAVNDFKRAGLYTVARIVLFKDDTLARRRPDLAVHRPDGSVWATYNGAAWVDPYQKKVWEYNVDIASQAAIAGFDEVQFDYIRFPTEGDLKACRFARAERTKKTDAQDLVDFLAYARARLKPMGVKLSIAIFGLTTTDDTGMGIGQHLEGMAEEVDYVSPMMYPSHYHKGEYGIPNPNREPYKTIHLGLRDATERLGADTWRLRPYFQDFSLGVHYGPKQVRDQIFAAARMGVTNWILWNPQNRYTWAAVPTAPEIEAVAKEKIQDDAKDAKENNEKP